MDLSSATARLTVAAINTCRINGIVAAESVDRPRRRSHDHGTSTDAGAELPAWRGRAAS
jgi:hypothetical protein